MKKLIIVSIITLVASRYTLVPIFAQATDSAEFDQKVNQNIKDLIEKVAGQETTTKRGWVGTIADIAQTTFTLTTKSGTRQASFADTTTFVESPGKKTLKSTDLAIGAHVIAIGFVNGNGVMDLRRLIVVTDFKATPERKVELVTLGEDKPKVTSTTHLTAGPDQKKVTTKDLTPGAKALLITIAGSLVRIHLL